MQGVIRFQEVGFQEVLDYFLGQHKNSTESDQRTITRLHKANAQLGLWVRADVSIDMILQVMLPHHNHHETMELIPHTGLPLTEAHQKLIQIEEEYAAANPKCMSAIRCLADNTIGTLILSQEPIYEDRNLVYMVNWQSHLIWLDGLHRLLAIPYYNREEELPSINCYVAIK